MLHSIVTYKFKPDLLPSNKNTDLADNFVGIRMTFVSRNQLRFLECLKNMRATTDQTILEESLE